MSVTGTPSIDAVASILLRITSQPRGRHSENEAADYRRVHDLPNLAKSCASLKDSRQILSIVPEM